MKKSTVSREGLLHDKNKQFAYLPFLSLLEQKDIDLDLEFDVHLGIAHTRWATHGVPSPVNSHPHRSDKTNGLMC